MRRARKLTSLSRLLLTPAAQATYICPASEQTVFKASITSKTSSLKGQNGWRCFAAEAGGAGGKASEIPWDPEHTNIGNECDKILLQTGEKDGIPGILKEIEMHGLTFNDNNIATAFEQLALYRGSLADDKVQAELFDRTPFKSLVEMAKIETDKFNPRQLADITASLGKLKFQDAGLLSKLIARTASKISEMDPEHLSKLSDGLAGSTAAGLSDLYKHISAKK